MQEVLYMQKSSLPVAVKTLMKYEREGTLNLKPPIQRKSGIWSALQKSLLIDSILRDFIVPNLYLQKESVDGSTNLSVLDGLQRLSTLFSFINDEWSLSNKLEPIIVDDEIYEIAGKKFSELPEDIQSMLTQYRFSTYQLENCTNEEIEETFSRLNGGIGLSKIQGARSKMGVANATWINELLEFEFFTKNLNLTLPMLRREDDLLVLLLTMMLLEDFYYGRFSIKTNASAAEAVRFAEYMRTNYSEDMKDNISLLIQYLDEAFDEEVKKFLRKNNIPIVMYVGFIAMNKNIEPREYGSAVETFFEDGATEKYLEASGAGNVRLEKIRIRLSELVGYIQSSFSEAFSDDDKEVFEQAG